VVLLQIRIWTVHIFSGLPTFPTEDFRGFSKIPHVNAELVT